MKLLSRPLATACLCVHAVHALASQTFDDFLSEVATEAIALGISEQLVAQAFTDLSTDPRVLRFDRNQPESTQTLGEYLAARITDAVVNEGNAMLNRHASTVADIEREHGVDGTVLIAVWGMESRYGRHTGSFSVIRSLATLAYDPRRSAFFRRELIAALRLADDESMAPAQLSGSWAGAMGQPQFMPTTFVRFATDGNGDGRRDIWHTPADVLASIAAVLADGGWRKGVAWGKAYDAAFEARDPTQDQGCRALRQHSPPLTLGSLPDGTMADLGAPADTPVTLWHADDKTFLATPNFHALLRYNCANSYALAVSMLADRLSPQR